MISWRRNPRERAPDGGAAMNPLLRTLFASAVRLVPAAVALFSGVALVKLLFLSPDPITSGPDWGMFIAKSLVLVLAVVLITSLLATKFAFAWWRRYLAGD